MVETRAERRVRMAARFRLPAMLFGLSPRAKALAARAGTVAEFWHVAARIAAAVPLMGSRASCGFPSPADDHLDGALDFNELMKIWYTLRVLPQRITRLDSGYAHPTFLTSD